MQISLIHADTHMYIPIQPNTYEHTMCTIHTNTNRYLPIQTITYNRYKYIPIHNMHANSHWYTSIQTNTYQYVQYIPYIQYIPYVQYIQIHVNTRQYQMSVHAKYIPCQILANTFHNTYHEVQYLPICTHKLQWHNFTDDLSSGAKNVIKSGLYPSNHLKIELLNWDFLHFCYTK